MNIKLSLAGSVPALVFSMAIASAASFDFSLVPAPGALPPTPAGQVSIQENFAGQATEGGDDIPVNTLAQDRTTDGSVGGSIATSVGVFTGLGGLGDGDSVTGNRGQIQIRSGDNFGRFNVLNPGENFLDSNDSHGFTWTIFNNPNLRSAAAFITDPNDAGLDLTVSLLVDGTEQDSTTIFGNRNTGSIFLLTTDFTQYISGWAEAVFRFEMNTRGTNPVLGLNDGIAISNATLNVIPLPAPALMLLSGIGALGGLSLARRRRTAARA